MLFVLTTFLAFSKGFEFKCNFGYVEWALVIGRAYACTSVQVTNNNNSTSLESVEGNHLDGNSNSDVKVLQVYGRTTIQKLPTNIERFFPHLEALSWLVAGLLTITADDLRPFPQMKYLDLQQNRFVSLDSDVFQHSPKLAHVELRDNKITNVGLDLLANLNELVRFSFYTNPCISFNAATPEEIQELKQKLVTQCPPLTLTTISTTTEETCDVRCTVNDEIDDLMRVIDEQKQSIVQLQDRTTELEKQMREMMSRP